MGWNSGVRKMQPRNIDKLLQRAYKRYCQGEDRCYVLTCPLVALMMNAGIHLKGGNLLLIYGDYRLLERMGR